MIKASSKMTMYETGNVNLLGEKSTFRKQATVYNSNNQSRSSSQHISPVKSNFALTNRRRPSK